MRFSSSLAATAVLAGTAAAQCKDYVLISARGTGEAQGPSIGFVSMINQTLTALPNGAEYDVVYPAAWSFEYQSGGRDLVRYITEGIAACPQQKYAILGYSQGAAVVGSGTRNITTGASYEQVKAIVVIGNTVRVPNKINDVDEKGGDGNRNRTGAFGTASSVPDGYYNDNKILDICYTNDWVCASGTGNTSDWGPHLSYTSNNEVQTNAAKFLISKLTGESAGALYSWTSTASSATSAAASSAATSSSAAATTPAVTSAAATSAPAAAGNGTSSDSYPTRAPYQTSAPYPANSTTGAGPTNPTSYAAAASTSRAASPSSYADSLPADDSYDSVTTTTRRRRATAGATTSGQAYQTPVAPSSAAPTTARYGNGTTGGSPSTYRAAGTGSVPVSSVISTSLHASIATSRPAVGTGSFTTIVAASTPAGTAAVPSAYATTPAAANPPSYSAPAYQPPSYAPAPSYGSSSSGTNESGSWLKKLLSKLKSLF